MDLMGPLPNSHGYRYVWASIDTFDRSCYLRGMKSTSAEEMANLLSKFFSEKGLWELLAIDSKCLSFKGVDKKLLDKLGVGILRSNRCSRHQGMVERLLQTVLIKILKILDNDERLNGWYLTLPKVEFLVNSSPHLSLNWKSPFELMYRRPPALMVPVLNEGSGEMKGSEFQQLVKTTEEVRKSAFRNLLRNKNFYECNEALVEGQVVWRKRQAFATNVNRKLQFRIIQAFIVLKRVGSGLYKVEDIESGLIAILPVDQLIRTRLTIPEVKQILQRLKS